MSIGRSSVEIHVPLISGDLPDIDEEAVIRSITEKLVGKVEQKHIGYFLGEEFGGGEALLMFDVT